LTKLRTYLVLVFSFLALILFLFPAKAHAYLDPGTGSYIIQIAIATFVGALFAIRLFWRRIKAFFKRQSSHQEADRQDDN
jgi:tellurite resistance protein TehA-like permease